MTTAKFTINATAAALRGYDALNSEGLSFQLEDSPALDVLACVYSVVIASPSAPALTLSGSGIASPPTAAVTTSAPSSGAHSYIIRCTITTDQGTQTFERLVCTRTLGARKIAPGETVQHDPTYGWTKAWSDLIDSYVAALAATEKPAVKLPVRVATTTAVAHAGLLTIDGVTLLAGDRVLDKDHGTASLRGIWVADAGAWTRATDFDSSDEVFAGVIVPVTEGTLSADTIWILTTDGAITVGSTSLAFTNITVPAALGADAVVETTGGGQLTATANTKGVSAATASTYVKRDGSAGAAFGYVSVGSSPAASGDLRVPDIFAAKAGAGAVAMLESTASLFTLGAASRDLLVNAKELEIQVDASGVNVTSTAGGELDVQVPAGLLNVNATDVAVEAANTITLTSTGGGQTVEIAVTGDTTIDAPSGGVIISAGAGDVDISASADASIASATITQTATGAVSIHGGAASSLACTAGDLSVSADSSTAAASVAAGTGGNRVAMTCDANDDSIYCSVNGAQYLKLKSSAVRVDVASLAFEPTVASPIIQQQQRATDAATQTLRVAAQDAYGSAVTNKTGGDLELGGGRGKVAGTDADGHVRLNIGSLVSGASRKLKIQTGSWASPTTVWEVGEIGSSTVEVLCTGRHMHLTTTAGFMLAASYNVVLAAALSAQLYGTTGVNIDTGSGTQTVRIGHNGTIGTPGSGTESWKVTVDGSTTSELHVSGTNKLLSTDGAQATSSSGATVDLYSHTCATGETIRVTAELHAARTDSGTNKAVRIISAAFKNIAGTVTQIGTTTALETYEDAALTSFGFDVATANTIKVQFAGRGSETWKGRVHVEIQTMVIA